MKGFTGCRIFFRRGHRKSCPARRISRPPRALRWPWRVASRRTRQITPESFWRKSKSFAAQYGTWKIFLGKARRMRWHISEKGCGKHLIFHPLHTRFDTASRFWVLNGITWHHRARTCQRRLCDGIRRNQDTSRKRKSVAKLRVNCSTIELPRQKIYLNNLQAQTFILAE